MPKMILTDASIRQLKSHKTRREIHDANSSGLYLFIQPKPSNAKSFAMVVTRPNGKLGKIYLGPFEKSQRTKPRERNPEIGDDLSLGDAHWLAEDIRRQRRAKKDVVADARAARQDKKDKTDETSTKFSSVAQQYVAEYAKLKTRRWKETSHNLGLDYLNDKQPFLKDGLADRWKDREINSITSDEVYHVVDDARRYGIAGIPRRNHGISDARGRAMARTLSKFFKWCLQHRKITVSPSVGVYVPPPPKTRERVLTEDEIVRFWKATDKLNEPFGSCLKLLLLTGARLREISEIRRSELTDDLAFLTIPGSRTKNKKEFTIPLPQLARGIIAKVKPKPSKAGFLFTTNSRTAINGFSKIKARLDELILAEAGPANGEVLPWRLHDLRRTTATIMNDSPPNGLGIAPHIVEACLNHVSGHKVGVAGVYNRAAYLPEKLDAFRRWALWVEGLVTGRKADVADIGAARKRKRVK